MARKGQWLSLSLFLVMAPPALAAPCTGLLPPKAVGPVQRTAISPEDLVRLRDIGPSSNDFIAQPIFDLSPDGKRVAFQIRQADPATNAYCLGIFTMDLAPGNEPTVVNIGGEFMPLVFSVAGFVEMSSPGVPANTPPRWSPDGQWLAFIRRDGTFPQLWRARADGSFSEPVTNVTFAVRDFVWSSDGHSLVFSGQPDLEAAKAGLEDEARMGFLYDERFFPIAKSWPFVREPIGTGVFSVDAETHLVRSANADEKSVLLPAPSAIPGATLVASGPKRVAWVAPGEGAKAAGQVLQAKRGRTTYRCDDTACTGIDQMWWSGDGHELIFLTRSPRRGSIALYAWNLVSPPRQILANDDVLMGCAMNGDRLICARERATEPRLLVAISLRDGNETVLFDPNPEFAAFRFGEVKRLYWKNDLGLETFGDLVLPPDHIAGQRHPLIVVQYESKGFLRGGTGDEFPVQAFASAGFAVLNFTRPQGYGQSKGITDSKAAIRASLKDWADRKSVLSSLESGVAAAIQTGTIDPAEIGLTGLSDGSSTVQHALIHSTMFKAAAVATCCDEASTIDFLDGPMATVYYHDFGFPALGADEAREWAGQSFKANAARIRTPLLMQLPDREYLGSLESYAALKAAGAPVEMYVYPDEYHIKWQPAHRLASYRRSLDWFRFWLKGEEDSDPSRRDQYARWRALQLLKSDTAGNSPGQ